ncbi:hypothetical protein DFH28DRAFT_900968 [Melampsora americana]|nr:hypothetical protein DFH28DRAFT_900968 [Melampsora americana]
MQKSRSKLEDLLDLFTLKTEIPDNQLPPTLFYSNSRKSTMTVLKQLNHARGVPRGEYNPKSTFGRRFHSNTGPTDKTANISDYAKSVYPNIACTLALGLGQNWTRVRRVYQMGRADAAAVSQILGRCGRNGQPGLGVFYVEKHRKYGKNSVSDFQGLTEFSDDDLMDGLAVTPVCLRVAFTLSNLIGRIPMSTEEQCYVAEKERQEKAGMCLCRCSNCESEACKQLVSKMKWLTISNFDMAVQNPEVMDNAGPARVCVESSLNVLNNVRNLEETHESDDPDAPIVNQKLNAPPPRRIELNELANQLTLTIEEHHQLLMENQDRLKTSDYVDDNDIWRILDKIHTIKNQNDIFNLLGCDILPGGVAKLFECINKWKLSTLGAQAISQMRAREAATRLVQAETLSRLQKQHAEREEKAQEDRVLKENKRKLHQMTQLAEQEAKRQRKTDIERKRAAAAKSKADQEAKRASNARMLAGLKAGKSMAEVEAEEATIRCQQANKENTPWLLSYSRSF